MENNPDVIDDEQSRGAVPNGQDSNLVRERCRTARARLPKEGLDHSPDMCLRQSRDYSVVITLIKKSQEELMKMVRGLFSEQKKYREEDRAAIEGLGNQVKELNSIVTATATVMIGKKRNGSNDQQNRINTTLCILPMLFSEHIICVVLSKIFTKFWSKELTNAFNQNHYRTGSTFIQLMFFRRKPCENRK